MNALRNWALFAISTLALATGCGDDGGNGNPDGNGTGVDADPNAPDADPNAPDANPNAPDADPGACVPGPSQCSNCVDDDGDGRIDGFDIECTGSADNDESSFETDIPGDNQDAVNQDCFFDGDSGAGNDGCNIHVCCLLGAETVQDCPIGANQFDPTECDAPQSQQCIDTCLQLVPPGCDCFGCCTLCDPTTDICYDVITNPNTAPNCDETTLGDPTACPTCVKVEACDVPCNNDNCELCPGQDPSDLPPSCVVVECPAGLDPCDPIDNSCGAGLFCTNGCCITAIE